MTEAPLTLRSFFGEDPARPLAESLDLSACMKAVEAAGADMPRVAMPAMKSAFEGALDDVLKVEVGDVLAASWKKLKGVRDALEATAKAPGTSAVVPLLEHKITSKHAPKIELYMGEQRLCELAMDIALSLQLKGVSLAIGDGRIQSLRGGVCTGGAELSFKGQPLIKRTSREFQLPGRLGFSKAAS